MLKLYFRNDFLVQLTICIGSYLVVSRLEKKNHFRLRFLAGALIIALWMMFFSVDVSASLEHGNKIMVLSILKYLGVFVLNVGMIQGYCKAGLFPALFAGTVGYSLQHMCERAWEIARYQLNLPVFLDRLCLAVVFAVALWIYWRLAIQGGQASGRFSSYEQLNNRLLLILASVVIIVCVLLDLFLRRFGPDPLPEIVLAYSRCVSALIAFMTVLVANSHMRETESMRLR